MANVPQNSATPAASRPRRPIPDSLSQINRRGTRPNPSINDHVPNNRSGVWRVGNIRPQMNRECAGTITSTGNNAVVPSSSGIRFGGNHKSHCAASPGAHTSRSAGSGRRCSGRNRATFSRNHDSDPDQPTRSASTVAGISGNSASNARTRSSNGVNDVAAGARSYFGGAVDATAFTTVFREIPNRSAICVFGTPSAASLRINAQSSKVITLQSSSAHFSTGATDQFSSVTDTPNAGLRRGPRARSERPDDPWLGGVLRYPFWAWAYRGHNETLVASARSVVAAEPSSEPDRSAIDADIWWSGTRGLVPVRQRPTSLATSGAQERQRRARMQKPACLERSNV